MRDSAESEALNFLMEDIALGVDERGNSEYCDADDNGRFGVNGMRDGLGVGGGAIVVVQLAVQFQIRSKMEFQLVAKRSHDTNHVLGDHSQDSSLGPKIWYQSPNFGLWSAN